MESNVSSAASGEEQLAPDDVADILLGVVLSLCNVIGTLGNITSFLYFMSQSKDVPTIVYTFITLTDILACSTAFPMAISYFKLRDSVLFGYPEFCYSWGILWAIIPFFSIFLVATISITRTFSLAFPLRKIRARHVVMTVSCYLIYLVLSNAIPLTIKHAKYVFTSADMYCWEDPGSGWYQQFDMFQGATLLAAPIVPIVISCIISIYFITKSLWFTKQLMFTSVKRKLRATITIVIVTAVYIVCNVPIFVVWIVYFTDGLTTRPTIFWTYYSWGVSYVVLVVVNATLNPFIYFFRMRNFRIFLLRWERPKTSSGNLELNFKTRKSVLFSGFKEDNVRYTFRR